MKWLYSAPVLGNMHQSSPHMWHAVEMVQLSQTICRCDQVVQWTVQCMNLFMDPPRMCVYELSQTDCVVWPLSDYAAMLGPQKAVE